MPREVTIDYGMIMRMSVQPDLVQMLPPLEGLVKAKQGTRGGKKCGGCGQQRTVNSPGMAERDKVLLEIANFLTAHKEVRTKLKHKLDASVIRVKYKKAGTRQPMLLKF